MFFKVAVTKKIAFVRIAIRMVTSSSPDHHLNTTVIVNILI